jgi:hypothetical protein
MMLQLVGKAKGQRITGASFDDVGAAALLRSLKILFAHWQARLLHKLHDAWATRGVAKADDDGKEGLWQWIDDAIDDALDPPSAITMHDIGDAMTRANAGAAAHTIRQIDLDDPQAISLRTNTEAVNYAAHRSAELVGKKYDADGNLIDSPSAAAAITDTTRNVLREEIRDAVGLHADVDTLADRIADTGLFSDARAEMIARTEINMAQNQGVLEAGRQAKAAGLPVRKVWVLGDNPCPLCEAAAAEGDIDLDADFGDEAGDAPPLHPNCECSLDLFVADEEEEAKMQDDDSDDDHLDASGDNGGRHVVDTLADLLAETGEFTREQALHYLLRTARGAAILQRVRAASRKRDDRKDSAMNRTEALTRIVRKAGGLGLLCQKIVKRGRSDVTEAELTGMITETAKHEHPDLTSEAAFVRLYTGNELLRRALQVAKAAPVLEPEQVGGDDATDVNDPAKALAQLRRMIDELRRRAHNLTESEAWSRVVRENPRLAKRAIAA